MLNKKFLVVALILLTVCFSLSAQAYKEQQYYSETGIAKPAVQSKAVYDLVGYTFVFELDGDEVTFKFIDIVGEDDIPTIAAVLMHILDDAVSYTKPASGKIVIKLASNLTQPEFDGFVEVAKWFIYRTMFN